MLGTILSVVGAVEVLAPRRLVDVAERIALENPDECEMRSWVVPLARAEGLAYLFLARRGDGSHSLFGKVLGVIGALALLYPRRFVRYSTAVAYTDPEGCEWKPWVYPATRLVGLVYVLAALGGRGED